MNHEPNHKIKRGLIKGKIPSLMRLLFWEVTAGCNLACVHCRRIDIARQMMANDLTTEEGIKLIRDIAEIGKPILVFSGGEPLIRPDLFDLIAEACRLQLPVALATNGTLIDRSLAKRIKTAGVERVSISLDGADDRTHDTFRKQTGSFEKAVQGLEDLASAGVDTQMNVTVTKRNLDQLDDLYALALEINVKAMHLFMLVPVGCGVQLSDEVQLEPAQYEAVLHWIHRRASEKKIHVRPTCAPHYFRVMHQKRKESGEDLPMHNHRFSQMTRGCLAGTGICFVSHKGEVFPCGYLPLLCGDVRKDSLSKVWQASPVLNQLRDPSLLSGKCGLCEYKNICLGCRARAYGETGDFLSEEPYCTYEPILRRNGTAEGSG